ncbi:hypothetical protein HCA93_14475 [Listeria innocua]|uniref:hypothetical protein n=1 Tax=Listeria innocua TaxID=1642 RepID=UPI001628F3C8|nr:hypothetical protein [Listeria innocua]MBC2137497.1 hypothetical protein [Listeria innocua]
MSLAGTIIYFIFEFGFSLYTKLFSYLVGHAFTDMGVNVFWSALFFGFIIVSVGIFCTIYMYTSFFALVLYPLCIFLIGPIIVIVTAYSLYLLVKILKERKQMAHSNK